MTRRKKLLLVLLVLVLVSQIPFAYRRYKLGRLHSAIQLVNSQRLPDTNESFTEYTGVIHVHSFLGGHSTGGFEEIIAAAKSNHLNFVVMTEHTSTDFNTAAMTLKGLHGGILFVNGNEVATASSDRLLLIPGDESAPSDGSSIQEVIAKAKARSALAFVAYPYEFKSWNAAGYDGVEVYNVYTNAQQIRPLVLFFDSLWSYRTYPNLLFADFYSRPDDSLRRWDEAIASQGRALVAVAGNDAHANVGINLQDASGKPLLGLQLDPYERSFQLVRVHVLVPKGKTLDSETLLEALRNGHCFMGFDLFGDTAGFSFSASNGAINKIQGDEISLEKEVRLTISTPVTSRVILFKDGQRMLDETGIKRKDYVVTEKGSYRVEVYLPQLPKPTGEKPWIISNPIYVR